MSYAKKWIPPSIPYRDNLPAWKAVFGDLHQNLLDAGLVQTDTAGQLVIGDVSSLPADGDYAGFIEYAFDDDLQAEAPVVIRLEFGCGMEGVSGYSAASHRSRTMRIRSTILFGGSSRQFVCPQSYSYSSASDTSQLTEAGTSALTYRKEAGFFGVVYGAGSRNKPFVSSYGNYYGATFTCFLQRSLDALGQPTGDGLMCYLPNLITKDGATPWTSGQLNRSLSVWMPFGGSPVARQDMAPRVGRSNLASGGDALLLEPIYAPSNPPRPFPFLYSYYHTTIGEGSEFEFAPFIGEPKNFIALGRETCMSIDSEDAHNAGLAMLFE